MKKVTADDKGYDYDVIYLGRLTYQKHPERLLQVLKMVKDVYPDLRAAVVGTGEMEQETRTEWEQLGLQENVDLLGFQSNPLKILKDARLMLMTSRWEGTPMCALESMALGTPIVSTPTDGLVDLVDDDATGYLSDDDEVLTEKIVKILKDKKLRQRLSANCIAKSEKINDKQVYKEALRKAYFGEKE